MNRLIEELIRSQVGKTADLREHQRNIRNPLNFIIDEAEKQCSKKFNVYWLDKGIPEHFSLLGTSYYPVVFSSRFLEISAFLRSLTQDIWSKEIRLELTERICLRLMSEFCLSYGETDLAVLAFIKSILGQSIHIATNNTLMDLELSPINESYMVTWFYGLIHEIGHIYSKDVLDLLPNESLINAFERGLMSFSVYPEDIKRKAREKLHSNNSVLSLAQLRQEVISDTFAISVLLKGTVNIMKEIKGQFKLQQFIAEIIIFMNILILFQKCKESARAASDQTSNYDRIEETLVFAPISFSVRSKMIVRHLERAYFPGGFDVNNTEEFNQVVSHNRNLIDITSESLKPALKDIDSGLAKAMRFFLFPNERETELMMKFSEYSASQSSSTYELMEARKFCEQAESLGLISNKMQKFRAMIGLEKIQLNYIVPWLEGPQGLSHPFGLDTKYGHLIFIFQTKGELYQTFFDISSQDLSHGYILQTALLVFYSTEEIEQYLAKTMLPSNKQFTVVFQGTKQFRVHMEELAEGTLWE